MTTGVALRRQAIERSQQDVLERALACAFWRAVQQDPIPAMAALEAAARAVGTLYRQMAKAHDAANGCSCGWQPDPESDLIVLEAMLAGAARPHRAFDLAAIPALGRA